MKIGFRPYTKKDFLWLCRSAWINLSKRGWDKCFLFPEFTKFKYFPNGDTMHITGHNLFGIVFYKEKIEKCAPRGGNIGQGFNYFIVDKSSNSDRAKWERSINEATYKAYLKSAKKRGVKAVPFEDAA